MNADGRSPEAAGLAANLPTTDFTAFDALVTERIGAWTAELVEFLRIPSEGGDVASLRAAADWTADRLRRAGAAVEIIEVADGELLPRL